MHFQLHTSLMTFYNLQVIWHWEGNFLSMVLLNLCFKESLIPQQIPTDILYLNHLTVLAFTTNSSSYV